MAPVTNFYLSKILLIFAMISFSQGRIFLNPSQQFTHPRSPATQGMYKNLLENCRKKNLLFYLIKSFIPVRQFKIHPMPSYKPADSLGSLCRNILIQTYSECPKSRMVSKYLPRKKAYEEEKLHILRLVSCIM